MKLNWGLKKIELLVKINFMSNKLKSVAQNNQNLNEMSKSNWFSFNEATLHWVYVDTLSGDDFLDFNRLRKASRCFLIALLPQSRIFSALQYQTFQQTFYHGLVVARKK